MSSTLTMGCVVTRNGRPAAVMIHPDELASLEDTLELLSDSEALAELVEARQAYADGDYVTGDELPSPLRSEVSGEGGSYELRVTGPAQRSWSVSLKEPPARSLVLFSALVENPHRVGGRLQRELSGLYSARTRTYRVVYEIDEEQRAVVVLRVDHRSRIYRSR